MSRKLRTDYFKEEDSDIKDVTKSKEIVFSGGAGIRRSLSNSIGLNLGILNNPELTDIQDNDLKVKN